MLLPLLATLAPRPVVCIDPGHPSEVGRGTRGRKLTELHVAWTVALDLRAALQRRGVKVVLTKAAEGTFVKNLDRSRIANEAGADLFLRLHCDAAAGTGTAVYHPTRTGMSNGVIGPSRAVLSRSHSAAVSFHRAYAAMLKGHLRDNGLKSDLATAVGAKQGALTGSIHSEVPVLLVEMCVLTNRKDEAFLLSRSGQARMVAALEVGTVAALQALGSSGAKRSTITPSGS